MRRGRHWFSATWELNLARMLTSLALFGTVALASLALTATGLKYSTDMIGQMAAATPVKTSNLRPRQVTRPAGARAGDLNVARSVPVVATGEAAPTRVAPPGFTHTVTVEALKVRAGPGQLEPQVFTLKGGSWVNISDNVQGWVRITDQAGKSGWAYGSLLRQETQLE